MPGYANSAIQQITGAKDQENPSRRQKNYTDSQFGCPSVFHRRAGEFLPDFLMKMTLRCHAAQTRKHINKSQDQKDHRFPTLDLQVDRDQDKKCYVTQHPKHIILEFHKRHLKRPDQRRYPKNKEDIQNISSHYIAKRYVHMPRESRANGYREFRGARPNGNNSQADN